MAADLNVTAENYEEVIRARVLPVGVRIMDVTTCLHHISGAPVAVILYKDENWGEYRLVTESEGDTSRQVKVLYNYRDHGDAAEKAWASFKKDVADFDGTTFDASLKA